MKIDFFPHVREEIYQNDKVHECLVGKGKAGAERPLSLSPKPINYNFVISTEGRNLFAKTL